MLQNPKVNLLLDTYLSLYKRLPPYKFDLVDVRTLSRDNLTFLLHLTNITSEDDEFAESDETILDLYYSLQRVPTFDETIPEGYSLITLIQLMYVSISNKNSFGIRNLYFRYLIANKIKSTYDISHLYSLYHNEIERIQIFNILTKLAPEIIKLRANNQLNLQNLSKRYPVYTFQMVFDQMKEDDLIMTQVPVAQVIDFFKYFDSIFPTPKFHSWCNLISEGIIPENTKLENSITVKSQLIYKLWRAGIPNFLMSPDLLNSNADFISLPNEITIADRYAIFPSNQFPVHELILVPDAIQMLNNMNQLSLSDLNLSYSDINHHNLRLDMESIVNYYRDHNLLRSEMAEIMFQTISITYKISYRGIKKHHYDTSIVKYLIYLHQIGIKSKIDVNTINVDENQVAKFKNDINYLIQTNQISQVQYNNTISFFPRILYGIHSVDQYFWTLFIKIIRNNSDLLHYIKTAFNHNMIFDLLSQDELIFVLYHGYIPRFNRVYQKVLPNLISTFDSILKSNKSREKIEMIENYYLRHYVIHISDDGITTLTHIYNYTGFLKALAVITEDRIFPYIINFGTVEIKKMIDALGIRVPSFITTTNEIERYYINNLNYYFDMINRTVKNEYPLNELSDIEIVRMYGCFIDYTDRTNLIERMNRLMQLDCQSFFITYNADSINTCSLTSLDSYKSLIAASTLVVGYGNLITYKCYELDELLSCFDFVSIADKKTEKSGKNEKSEKAEKSGKTEKLEKSTFRFRIPETPNINFPKNQVLKLRNLLRCFSYLNLKAFDPKAKKLVDIISLGLQEYDKYNKEERIIRKKVKSCTLEQKELTIRSLKQIFDLGMTIRGWDGKGKYPLQKKDSGDEGHTNEKVKLQSRIILVSIFENLNRDNKVNLILSKLNVYNVTHGQLIRDSYTLQKLYSDVVKDKICIRIASTLFIGYSLHYMKLLFDIDFCIDIKELERVQ